MPQERENQFPMPTAGEVEEVPGHPAVKAARNIVSRHITGIPKRGYVMGTCDSAPILRAVAEFAEAVQEMIAAIPDSQLNGSLRDRVYDVREMMADSKCPTSRAQ